jgi:hypothetical protein
MNEENALQALRVCYENMQAVKNAATAIYDVMKEFQRKLPDVFPQNCHKFLPKIIEADYLFEHELMQKAFGARLMSIKFNERFFELFFQENQNIDAFRDKLLKPNARGVTPFELMQNNIQILKERLENFERDLGKYFLQPLRNNILNLRVGDNPEAFGARLAELFNPQNMPEEAIESLIRSKYPDFDDMDEVAQGLIRDNFSTVSQMSPDMVEATLAPLRSSSDGTAEVVDFNREQKRFVLEVRDKIGQMTQDFIPVADALLAALQEVNEVVLQGRG